ncbi:pickpocket protein 28-like [Anthonomus grandis grandis]|uniref:pickpocket protein 28-like n=1 Tax=Anthonomus grandis grandis TaxID=2921223 RepID=UPI002165475C|nr:pickpocket protein 28-like [Anthonomus grandis grandis]
MTIIASPRKKTFEKGLDLRVSLHNRTVRGKILKMIRSSENAIRPRKSTNWSSDPVKHNKPLIFKIGDNESSNEHPGQLSYSHYYNNKSIRKQETPVTTDVKKSVIQQLEKYCENTTLHGLRYVGDPQLTFGERFFWLISFTLAVGFAAYYISNIYAKWKSSPVIISFSPFDAELGSIPFPAITICNMNQAKRNEAEKILKEGSEVEKKLLDDACNGNATFSNNENISWESLRDFLVKVGNSCSDILKSCKWGSDKINCEEHFNNDLTDEGLCCSFNRLPPEKIFRNMKDISILNQTYPSNVYDWNAEKGFEDIDYGDYIPRRPLGAGAHLGLSVILDAQINNYYCSSTRSTGFKVILSNPIETPKMADFGFLISPGYETRVSIEPNIREATVSLRGVPIEKRQCYFSNERPLQYYRTYTQRNCKQECQSNHTLSICQCVPYYLPKNKQMKYCGKSDQPCVEQAKYDMETALGNGSSCFCLPSCYAINYEDHKSFSPLSLVKNDDISSVSSENFVNDIAVVQFYFMSTQFSKEVKSELYGFTEILSNTGGLLSLCLGFSFLSLIELIYFGTLKVCCDVFQKSSHKRGKSAPVIPFLR